MMVIGEQGASYRHGMEINMPLVSLQVTKKIENTEYKNRYLGRFSFLEIDPKNILLSALRMSEDNKSVIVRFFETEGKKLLPI